MKFKHKKQEESSTLFILAIKRKILLKQPEEKETHMYRGPKMRAIADFSLHTIQVRRHWSNIFKVLKVKKKSS